MKFILSTPWKPHYESKPYRPAPGRREFIHGPLHALECRCAACKKVAA